MTRSEAIQLMDLSESPDRFAVLKVYGSRKTELTQRIASAPTPALREKYEQQAARLRQARDLLLGDSQLRDDLAPLTLTKQRDLPVPTPMSTGPGPVSVAVKEIPASRTLRASSPALVDGTLSLTQQHDLPLPTPFHSSVGGDSGLDPVQPGGAALGITPGQVLAERFEVRALLGSGGMGAVFEVFDRVRTEEVALKVLLPHLLADPKALERFLNEAKIASNLSHANIVRVYDIHRTPGRTFLTMERLQGRSLREEIARRQQTAERFKVAEMLSIAKPLCEGLHYAHGQTVHRDVKPENVWLCEDGTVKLMDFGIARLLRPSQFTSTGLALGTAYYMAPEQLRGQEVDHRADQFALAVVLYELLTGEIPQGVIKPPHQLRRSVPAGMSLAVMKSLESRPEARHADMAALGRALASPSRSRVGTRAVVATVVALLLGAVVTFPAWRTWIAGLKFKGDFTLATATPEPTAETKAAESAYTKQWIPAEELRKQAEAIGAKDESEAQNASDEAAKQVAGLWGRHPRRKEWLKRAAELRDSARAAAEKHSFDRACSDLKSAELEYRKPQQWSSNARQAMESINQTRAFIQKQLERFPADSARLLLSWPEALTAAVEDKLLEGDGEEGLSEARRLSERLPAIGKLFAQRQDVLEAALASQEGARDEEFKPRYDAAGTRIQEADGALVKDRRSDAGRLYSAAETDFRAVLAALNDRRRLAAADAAAKALRDKIHDPGSAITNSIGMKLALIPAGEFLMGSPDGEGEHDEHPQHKVRITRPFHLGVCEVTQEEYEKVMGENPSHFSDRGEGTPKAHSQDTRRHPVENVSWVEAVAFCRKLSEREGKIYRLPTEAEWEYACRAGSTTAFCFGNDQLGMVEYGWFGENSDPRTHPVGRKTPNAFGLYDMHGNVWEWCSDWYSDDYYKQSPVDDPPGAFGASARVNRGGGWYGGPRRCRSAYRFRDAPEGRSTDLGFRLALVPSGR